MLWGYFSSAGARKLVVVLGNTNRAKYRKILGNKSLQDLSQAWWFTLEQDYDFEQPERYNRMVYIKAYTVYVFITQSNLNPIDNIWKDLKIDV